MSIIAQVEGSGTVAVMGVMVPVKLPEPAKVRSVMKAVGILRIKRQTRIDPKDLEFADAAGGEVEDRIGSERRVEHKRSSIP